MGLINLLIRKIVIATIRVICRINVQNRGNATPDKGLLLVSNHSSIFDGILMGISLDREIQFIVERNYSENKLVGFLCRLFGAIPLECSAGDNEPDSAFVAAVEAIKAGKTVCYFAEGSVSQIGFLRQFDSGFKKIAQSANCEIVPAYIGGSWAIGRELSNHKAAVLPKMSRLNIGIHFGSPLNCEVTPAQLTHQVSLLSCDYFNSLKKTRNSLSEEFVSVARRNWFSRCISDSFGKEFTYGKLLVVALIISAKIKRSCADQKHIGVLLPSSCGGVLTNLAIVLSGKISVNLNYTASQNARDIAVCECELKTIYTSKLFLKKMPALEKREQYVYLEKLLPQISLADKTIAFLKSVFVPIHFLDLKSDLGGDSVAAIIYSSGSTGRPKGVLLSHHNILSNVEAAKIVFNIKLEDCLCGILPLFHSFGYTCTMWLPLLSGASASYIPNPLDCDGVAQTVREKRCSILLATPTFVAGYTRRICKEDFASLRIILTGAEKLKKKVAQAFIDKFEREIFEGYGATELSPIATLNVANVEFESETQVANKRGTVGMPIPGVAVKIVDVETSAKLAPLNSGLVFVKGPNVMLGYKNMPDETSDCLQNGWYCTGDIGEIDLDGFLTMKDRLSRFSKIGGEMVPHMAIEEQYMDIGEWDYQVIAITSIPSDRKGEELIVLYLPEASRKIEALHDAIMQSDMINIWKPKRNNYFQISEIPLLGTGKLNILALRKLALEAKLGDC